MAKILILGGGFAAVSAAETLAAVVGDNDEVTLVSNSSDLTFFPAIVPMVFGDLAPEEIRFDLRPALGAHNIRFLQGKVRAINARRRKVEVSRDRLDISLDFDYLVIALGPRIGCGVVSRHSENAHNILTIDGAIKFKEAISTFRSGSIVVGLFPQANLPVPVCESAFALSEMFSNEIKRGEVSVTAVFPSTVEKAFAGSTLFRDVDEEFDRKGIRLVPDFPIARVEKNEIVSTSGGSIQHELLMLIPPFASQLSLNNNLDSITDLEGFAKVDRFLKVEGEEGIYAAGDIVSLPGPKFGYMAIRQGKVAATNILAELRGDAASAEYIHKIEWAIGERYTDPIFFHYGFWDNTLEDFEDNALFGMAKKVRDRYGRINIDVAKSGFTSV